MWWRCKPISTYISCPPLLESKTFSHKYSNIRYIFRTYTRSCSHVFTHSATDSLIRQLYIIGVPTLQGIMFQKGKLCWYFGFIARLLLLNMGQIQLTFWYFCLDVICLLTDFNRACNYDKIVLSMSYDSTKIQHE